MRKRIMMFLLVAVFAFGTLIPQTVSTYAADIEKTTVAVIERGGETLQYASLQDAIDAAQTSETVKLVKNVRGYFPITGKTLTIDMDGYTVTAAASGTMYNSHDLLRAFDISGGEVTIKNGTITGANAVGNAGSTYWGGALSQYNGAKVTLQNMDISGNIGTVIEASAATLTIQNSNIHDNDLTSSYGKTSDYARGLIHLFSSSKLAMSDSKITNNSGDRGMAMIYVNNDSCSATLTGCDIKDNRAYYGALYISGSTTTGVSVTLNDTTVSGNTGVNNTTGSGGVYISRGILTLNDSAIYGNKSVGTSVFGTDLILSGVGGAIIKASDMSDHGTKLEGYVYKNGVDGTQKEDAFMAKSYTTSKDQYTVIPKEGADGAWQYGANTYSTLTDAAKAYIADNGASGEIKLLMDVKEQDTLPAIGTKDAQVVIDLDGHKVTNSSDNAYTISLSIGTCVKVKNGTLSGGKGGIGGTATKDCYVTAKDLTIEGSNDTAIKMMGAGTKKLTASNCTFKNCGILAKTTTSYAVYVNGNLDISECIFEDNYGGVFTQAAQDPRIENCKFTGHTYKCIYFQNVANTATLPTTQVLIKGCEFTDNNTRVPGYTNGWFPIIEFPNTFVPYVIDDCTFTDNVVEKFLIKTTSGGSYTFKNCLIENNEAYSDYSTGTAFCAVAGIYCYGATVLDGTVIKNNKAEGLGQYNAGGLFVSNDLTVTNSAIYNNTAICTEDSSLPRANDILDNTSSGTLSVPAAKDMVDGSVDFSNYIWKEAQTAGEIETALSRNGAGKYYTAQLRTGVKPVAQIGETPYYSLKEAVDAAKNGDVIRIVVQEYEPTVKSINEDPITVAGKKISIDINGIKVSTKGGNLFTVKDGGDLTIKDSVADKYYTEDDYGNIPALNDSVSKHSGLLSGKVSVEVGGSFTSRSVMESLVIDHKGDNVTLEQPIYVSRINLDADKVVDLGEGWERETTGNSLCKMTFALDSIVLTSLNDGTRIDDVILTNGGGDGIQRFTTVNGLTNKDIRKTYLNDNLLLTQEMKAIYLDGVAGNDNYDGTLENPVYTFEEAKERLTEALNNGEDYEGIVVEGAVTVKDEAAWDLKIDGHVYKLIRYKEFDGNLVKVAGGGKLTLTNIVFDGQGAEGVVAGKASNQKSDRGNGSLINVRPKGELTVSGGAVLQNNYIQTESGWTSCGGAIYSAGKTKITATNARNLHKAKAKNASGVASSTDAVIRQNKAVQGAGIYQVGKEIYAETDYTGELLIEGGTIMQNTAVYSDAAKGGQVRDESLLTAGGGVMAGYGARVCISGGSLDSNKSQNIGGGIAIGNTRDSEATCYIPSGTTEFCMCGDTVINGNYAYSEGGGIYVQINSVANVVSGIISKNTAMGFYQGTGRGASIGGNVSHCGGGIYVNGASKSWYDSEVKSKSSSYADYKAGTLYLNDAEIAYNKTSEIMGEGGSALAFCASGDAKFFELHSSVIHDNEDRRGIDVFMTMVNHNNGQKHNILVDNLTYYLPAYTINGEAYEWKQVNPSNYEVGAEATSEQLHYANTKLALQTDLSNEDGSLDEAISKTSVHILENEAQYYGGGIGSNGAVINGYESPVIDVHAEKKWDDNENDAQIRPDTVKLTLQRRVEGAGNEAWKDMKTTEVSQEDGKWQVDFEELPEYQKYKGNIIDCFCDDCEDCVTGDTENVKWEYRVIEDTSYHPDVSGSLIWTGEDNDGKAIKDMYDVTTENPADGSRDGNENYSFGKIAIKNFEITNKLKSGDMQVTKKVGGSGSDKSKKFEFTITLDNPVINGTYGDMTFKDGVAKVELADNETAKATGLPIDTKYEVAEKNYVTDGYVTSKADTHGSTSAELSDAKGTIVANEYKDANDPAKVTKDNTGKVTFTNTRNSDGSLTISKQIAGNAISDQGDTEFMFTITLDDKNINETYSDVKFTGGVATIKLKGNEQKVIEGLPGGTGYAVTETGIDGWETSISDNDGDTDEAKTDGKGIISDKAPRVVSFRNEMNTFGDLEVKKTLAGDGIEAETDKEFGFTITLSDKRFNGTLSGVEFTGGTAKISIKGGESKTITGIPNGTTYRVEEDDYSAAGFEKPQFKDATGMIAGGEITGTEVVNTKNTYKLTIKKTAGVSNANVGDIIEYTIVVKNEGLGVANEVTLRDILGKGLKYVSDDSDGTNNGQITTWLKDIQPGESLTFVIRARVTRAAVTNESVTNSAKLLVEGEDPGEEYEDEATVEIEQEKDNEIKTGKIVTKKKTKTPKKTKVKKLTQNTIKTGDSMRLFAWLGTLMTSAIVIAFVLRRRKA